MKRIIKLTFSLIAMQFFCINSWGQYKYVITTVAGNGINGYSGDGGLAVDAEIKNPKTVVLDGANNIYIGDGANVIRQVNAKTGIISTVAGTGALGFSGDGGPAILATMSYPVILAADTRGMLYLGDDYRIRKVDDTKNIFTIVGNGNAGFSSDGGLADTTMIHGCSALVFDDTGNIIFNDALNNRIRKVSVTNGIITTIAGNGTNTSTGDGGSAITAGVCFPQGLCFNKDYSVLYVSTGCSGKIRQIDMKTGIISLFAGGSIGYSGDGGAALSAGLYQPFSLRCDAFDNLFLVDEHTNVVRRIDAATGIINTIAGAKYASTSGLGGYSGDGGDANNAQLYGPSGIAIDSSGDIYFADAQNNRVRKLSIATGISGIFLEHLLDVYPDPANEYINLDLLDGQSAHIYNTIGMLVSTTENISPTASRLDVSTLPTGVYIVAVVYKDGSKRTGRFIKQ